VLIKPAMHRCSCLQPFYDGLETANCRLQLDREGARKGSIDQPNGVTMTGRKNKKSEAKLKHSENVIDFPLKSKFHFFGC
jgi:hypothetical protein